MKIEITYNEDTDCFEAWRLDKNGKRKLWECHFSDDISELMETDLDQLKIDVLEGSDE